MLANILRDSICTFAKFLMNNPVPFPPEVVSYITESFKYTRDVSCTKKFSPGFVIKANV